jgi:hypothetical protein
MLSMIQLISRLLLLRLAFPFVAGDAAFAATSKCNTMVDADDAALLQLMQKHMEPIPQVPINGKLTLEHFHRNGGCYDRATRNQWAVTDLHLHARPFNGPPVPFEELIGRLQRADVLFAVLYGIGQRLPVHSGCVYYLDCPGTKVTSSLKSDFFNAQTLLDHTDLVSTSIGPHLTLSMSFPDLSVPESILPVMQLLDVEFPGLFHWMGELNVVKQALFENGATPVKLEDIPKMAPFMAELKRKGMPIAFHSDLGNEEDSLKYLPLMDEILKLYPDNKVIWLHLGGLSKQLAPKLQEVSLLDVQKIFIQNHIQILETRLQRYPNLYVDLSWDVLYKSVFEDPEQRKFYLDLFNAYPKRFLAGTDHVAAAAKTEEVYREELNKTSFVYRDLDDFAFRRITLGENFFELLGLNFTAPEVCRMTATNSSFQLG